MFGSDDIVEGNEVFSVIVPTGGRPALVNFMIGSGDFSSGNVTIEDDDADSGIISVSAATDRVSEGRDAIFTVSLSDNATFDGDIVVEWSVSCGDVGITAADFSGSPCEMGTVTIVSGETSATFAVSTIDDNLVEGMETFTVTLSNVSPINGLIRVSDSMNSASVTIEDEDEAILSVSAPAEVYEAVDRMNSAEFEVTLIGGVMAVADITVDWSVTCATNVTGAASAADFADFGDDCPSGSTTILAGETSAMFSFDIASDVIQEGTERFTVSFTATTAMNRFDVVFENGLDEFEVILRDDEAVDVSVLLSSTRVSEGGSVTFYLELDEAVSEETTWPWEVEIIRDIGLASADDFALDQALSGTVIVPANSRTSATVTLGVRTDALLEGDEIFRVMVPIMGRPESDDFVIQSVVFFSEDVTIEDENSGEITISPVVQSVDEGDTAMFIVNLSGGATDRDSIVVSWSVSCGGDITASDFDGSPCEVGRATIVSGETSATFAVSTRNDNLVEGVETFTVALLTVLPNLNGRITISESMSTASVTIADGDEAILSVFAPASVDERVPEMRTAVFEVELARGVTADANIRVEWEVDCDTTGTIGHASAADFVDFGGLCPSGEVTIMSGETSGIFSFTILPDGITEGTERFTVSFTATTAGNFDVVFENGLDEFEVILLDGDAAEVTVMTSDSSVDEGGFVTFHLMLAEAISEELNLPWEVDFGSASVDDFEPDQVLSGILTIAAESLTSETVTLRVRTDNIVEGDEIFSVIVPTAGRPASVDFRIRAVEFRSDDVTINDDVRPCWNDFCECRSVDCK